ncbi:18358_t:CDS:2 [Dentiscutata erythropus]|uniref:18358_t:CDS:1 n=1 Tax=Dentiscutata erythropus TaxID=1348616 RepID=A0A9N9G262_9GLOM|nr:18358_t:CDS:2 [Dentiscutata erythropus]
MNHFLYVLKQAIEENAVLKIRFEELEKKHKTDTAKLTAKNAELKDRVTKLEQKQTQIITNDLDASSMKDILQSMACSELSVNTQIWAQIPISFKISDESKGSLSIQLPIEGQSDKERDINPNLFPELEHSLTKPELLAESETFQSSLSQDIINDNSVEILEFVYKENISNVVRERNRKKKLQSQGSMQNISSSSSDIQNEINPCR